MTDQTHTATILFEDGASAAVPVEPGTSVLDAADEQGFFLASQCRAGSCGTCSASLLEGSVAPVPGRAQSLLPSEYRDGVRLLCSTVLESDATFQLPYAVGLAADQPATSTARVIRIDRLSSTVVELALELPASADPRRYAAGQYARLRVPGTDEWRSYSMAGSSSELPRLRFLVKLLPDGVMSSYLEKACAVGDELDLEYPLGGFSLREPGGPQLFVAGGTGIAPLMAMLDELRERRGRKPPVTLVFGCRTDADLFFVEEIEMREFWMPTLSVRIGVADDESAVSRVDRGDPVTLIGNEPLAEGTEAYVCGPPAMIAAAVTRLEALGVPAERIHAEKFLPTDV